ncbi:MAG: hemerythrin domain-containing protein [Marmoricola sp.]
MTENTTSITTIGEVVDFLKEQHTTIKEMLPSVLQATGPERTTAFATVRQTLAIHEAFEQVVVHPHARQDVDGQVVDERVDEEDEAADAIAKLESLDTDDRAFHDAYSAFMLDVIEHAEHEEHEEFESITHTFSETECARIQRGVELANSMGDAPASDLTFAEMLENAKQAITG